jgi:bla regulator protein blaR1
MMPDLVQTLALWVSRTSWQAMMLVGLVLLIQALLGARLPARWRHALWWVVVLKLLLPALPQAPFSLFHFSLLESPTPIVHALTSAGAPDSFGLGGFLATAWPWIWMVGALSALGIILREHTRLVRAVVRQRPVTNPAILDVLEDCKSLMRIYTPLIVIESSKVSSPALFGFVRPRLLLPRGTLQSLSPQELRHVFLHELAHLQRHDIAFGWLLAFAQALHWFNPIVWFALHRARVDREFATDELALHFAQLGENRPYAETMIKLLDQFSRPIRMPAVVGILEDQRQMARRIRQIARFGSIRTQPLAAAALLLVLALTGLTHGRSVPDLTRPATAIVDAQDPAAVSSAPSAPAP